MHIHIPPEICETIVSHFLPFEHDDSYDVNLITLTQCALVSQEFSSIARPLIFTNVFVREGSDRDEARRKLELLEIAFKCNSSLPSLVRSFTLRTAGCNRFNINKEDNLYHHPSLPFLFSQFTRLESLAIESSVPVDSPHGYNMEWRRLPKQLQAAFGRVVDANSKHLKRLDLSKVPGIPLLTWAWKLESLSYLSIGPFMCARTLEEEEHPEQLVNGLTRLGAAPSHIEFRQTPWHPYLKRLMNLHPGFFRKTKDAMISTNRTADISETLTAFLGETADTLESFTLDLRIWAGESKSDSVSAVQRRHELTLLLDGIHAEEFPTLCSLTELALRFEFVHPNLWGAYTSFPRPFLQFCGQFLENTPKLINLSISIVGLCILLTETPMGAISPLCEFDEVFARNLPATLQSVRIEMVQSCPSNGGCDKCVGFGSSYSEREVREALPSLGNLPGTKVEYITERRVRVLEEYHS